MADVSRRFIVKIADGPFATEAYAGEATGTADIEYTAAPYLNATHMTWTTNGEVAEARICFVPDKDSGFLHPEDVFNNLYYHTPCQIWDTHTADSESDGTLIFQGVLYVKSQIKFGGTDEKIDLVAYNNADDLLRRICIHGQTRRSPSREQTYCNNGADEGGDSVPITPTDDLAKIDTPCIFNPDGLGNATDEEYELTNTVGDGESNATIHIFEQPGRQDATTDGTLLKAEPWKLSWAIKYLMNTYDTLWAVDPASVDDTDGNALSIFETYGDPVISNVNLEGKTIAQALTSLLEPYNYGWSCDPIPTGGTGFVHSFNIFYRGEGVSEPIYCTPRGTAPDPSDTTTNLINSDLIEDTTCVVNNINGYGAQVEVTTTADTDASGTVLFLTEGWEDSDLTFAYDDDGTTVNVNDREFVKKFCHPDLITVNGDKTIYGIGRMWRVNISNECPSVPLENLTTDFALDGDTTSYNSADRRQFRRPQLYTQNRQGGLLHQEDIQVEVSTDNGDNWAPVEKQWYRVLPSGMGIVFTPPHLKRLGIKQTNSGSSPKGYWQAYADDTLEIRVLCSVRSDERINGESPNNGDTVPLATERIFHNDGYRKFAFDPSVDDTRYVTNYRPSRPDQDDTDDLQTLTDQQQAMSDRSYFAGTISVFYDRSSQYQTGTPISEITNRISFDPMPTVIRIAYDLENLHTQLILDSHRVGSVVGKKPVYNASVDAMRHGIHNMGMADGVEVPFIQGNAKSYRQYMRDQMGGGN